MDFFSSSTFKNLPRDYQNCITDFLKEVIKENNYNLHSILMYGGIIRDASVIKGWSDIDLLIIYNDILKRNPLVIRDYITKYSNKYNIKLDVNELEKRELDANNFISLKMHGEYSNAINLRDNVSLVIYGVNPLNTTTYYTECEAAKIYINKTYLQLRKYIIDNPLSQKMIVRLLKWTFSIIRESLILFGIYSHPYEDSIINLKKIFPTMDISVLYDLANIRRNIYSLQEHNLSDLVLKIELFLTTYIKSIEKKLNYYEQKCFI